MNKIYLFILLFFFSFQRRLRFSLSLSLPDLNFLSMHACWSVSYSLRRTRPQFFWRQRFNFLSLENCVSREAMRHSSKSDPDRTLFFPPTTHKHWDSQCLCVVTHTSHQTSVSETEFKQTNRHPLPSQICLIS